MKEIKPYFEVISKIDRNRILRNLEIAGRTCYKSEEKITDDSAGLFVKHLIKRGHESVLEHEKITVRFVCDRGVSHELVRHRIASFSQESTRYCNYGKSGECVFITPAWIDPDHKTYSIWKSAMQKAESDYLSLLNLGWSPQQARTVLPNSLKTEIVVTANLREWRTIFKQRCSTAAHPQMREIMLPFYQHCKKILPELFNDLIF
jgi:thymidylate synthase (FAD)